MKKPSAYTMLWALIAVALIVFLCISFLLPEDSLPIKQAGFKEALTKERPDTAGDTAAGADALIAEGLAKATAVDSAKAGSGARPVDTRPISEPDTTVGSVLIFGDSMTILVANRLGQYGKKNGYKVHSVTWDGSSSVAWGNSDKLDQYIEKYKPDFIFVTLGSNEVFLQNFDARAKNVKKVVEKFHGIPYLWIGPPIWTDNRGFDEMMERTLPRGTYFRTDMDLKRGPDHIHPTRQSGVVWTDSVMRWMRRSPHPILAERPDSTTKGSNLEVVYIPLKN